MLSFRALCCCFLFVLLLFVLNAWLQGAWKERYQSILDSLPPPPREGPPLPPPGCERIIFHIDMDCTICVFVAL